MKNIKYFFQQNINEIFSDRILIWWGCLFFSLNIITGLDWIYTEKQEYFDSSNFLVSCFPFFSDCYNYINNDILNVYYVFWVMILSSVFGIISFLYKKTYLAYALLIIATLIKFVLFISRYNLMGNYHAMHFVLVFLFLYINNKRNILLPTLCLMYFSAGLLKINPEWISGAALLSHPFLKGNFLFLATSYVIVLELLLIWTFLIKDKRFFVLLTAQLFIFHSYSWLIVGYFYPLTMLCLLAPIYLSVVFNNYKFFNYNQITKSGWVFLALILLVNIIPKIIYDETSLDGGRRLFSLNMLDARTKCSRTTLLSKENEVGIIAKPHYSFSVRTACDPIHYDDFLKRLCQEDNGEHKISFFLESKRSTSFNYSIVRDIKDACKK